MSTPTFDPTLFPGCDQPVALNAYTPLQVYGGHYPSANDNLWSFSPMKGIQFNKGGRQSYAVALEEQRRFYDTNPNDFRLDDFGDIVYDPLAGNLTLHEARYRQMYPDYALNQNYERLKWGTGFGFGCGSSCRSGSCAFPGQQAFDSKELCEMQATHYTNTVREPLVKIRAPPPLAPYVQGYM